MYAIAVRIAPATTSMNVIMENIAASIQTILRGRPTRECLYGTSEMSNDPSIIHSMRRILASNHLKTLPAKVFTAKLKINGLYYNLVIQHFQQSDFLVPRNTDYDQLRRNYAVTQ